MGRREIAITVEVEVRRDDRARVLSADDDALRGERTGSLVAQGTANPQYVWDCMFRRRGGRIMVAIFVYRVKSGGADSTFYRVPVIPDTNDPFEQPMPFRLDLEDNSAGSGEPWRGDEGAWDTIDFSAAGPPYPLRTFIPGTEPGTVFNAGDPSHQWQIAGQRLLDENGFVHEVLFGRRTANDGPVELERPVPEVLLGGDTAFGTQVGAFDNYRVLPVTGLYENVSNGLAEENVVSQLWYVPVLDRNGRELVPVHVTVEEL